MDPFKKTLVYIATCVSIFAVSYYLLINTNMFIMGIIHILSMLGSIIVALPVFVKARGLWEFRNSDAGSEIILIDTMYKAGAICIDDDNFNYQFIGAHPVDVAGLEDLPPKSSKTSRMIYPHETEDEVTVLLGDNPEENIKSYRRMAIPFIVCRWPKEYKTPKAIRIEKAKEEFESGLNAAYMLTDGKQGKPSKYLT